MEAAGGVGDAALLIGAVAEIGSGKSTVGEGLGVDESEPGHCAREPKGGRTAQ